MEKLKNTKLQTWFGDFGGDVCDSEVMNAPWDAQRFETILQKDEFYKYFENNIKIMKLDIENKIKKFKVKNREITIVPRLASLYAIAGQLAIAQCEKITKIITATDEKEIAEIIVKTCKQLGLEIEVALSEKLCLDNDFINHLMELGCSKVENDFCVTYFDQPFTALGKMSMMSKDAYILVATANYYQAPYPALVGLLSSVYGNIVNEKLKDEQLDAVIVPIKDGTNALGLFKGIDTSARKITYEDTISTEYHNGESLLTRSANNIEPNTTLCPELANLYRRAEVARIGCDRIRKIDISSLENICASKKTKEAIALSIEYFDCKNMLVMEAEYE